MDYREDVYGDEAWYGYRSHEDFDGSSPWFRHLAYDKKKTSGYRMDYSVLSVAVMTLGLIMVVEVFLHNLDHAAHGRPYFTAVLENIYSELAILGLVEFCVFLMQEYYEDYNKEKKDVFGAVHFALFYTAIFNAFQSMILAYAVNRVSRKMWVQTEALELNHYVEIREEFDKISSELDRVKKGLHKSSNASTSGSEDDKADKANRWSEVTPDAYESNTGLRGLVQATIDRIRYPRLKSRYNELLVQVRFHELRVHFLRAYNLPLKLKIADYLLRSQQSVLIKLVHVSSTAWLLLTASINLLYFALGIVGTKTGDPGLVGMSLIYIFFFCMTIFIVLAIMVRKKIKRIFAQIMHRRELWEVQEDADEKERLAAEQMSLFWGSSPKLIIAAIQFMQFGYAVALSTVIMFLEEIGDGGVGMLWYWIAITVCYSLFVMVAAQVIPRYTLCTSLGQLVDKKRLSESVATFNLEEAKRQRREEMFLRAQQGDTLRILAAPAPPLLSKRDSDVSSKHSSREERTSFSTTTDSIPSERTGVSIADLVSLGTDSLRTNLPETERDALAARLANRRDRRKRMKSVSDGVAFMASLGKAHDSKPAVVAPFAKQVPLQIRAKDDSSVSVSNNEELSSNPSGNEVAPQEPLMADDTRRQHLLERRKSRRGRMKTLSDGVALMAAMKEGQTPQPPQPPRLGMVRENSERIADLVFMKTDSLRQNLDSTELQKMSERDERRSYRKKSNSDGVSDMRNSFKDSKPQPAGRTRRRKAVSDGVSAMAAMRGSDRFNSIPDVIPDSSESSSVIDAIPHELSQRSKDPDNGIKEENIENASMRSLASGSGYYSDMDDVPEADPAMMKLVTVEVQHHRKTLREKAVDYFLSKRYPVMSHVFGTMIAFFIVGSRIERFLHTENIVSEEWISFDFGETVTFWAFTGLLTSFLLVDGLIVVSLGFYHSLHALRARKVWVAAVLDFLLCSACLTIFYMAEHNRCCYVSENEDYRFLEEYDSYTKDSKYDSYAEEPEYTYKKALLPAPCACQAFGSRLYGGLGTIEPYISLIALRLLRFWTASRIVKYLDKARGTAITKEEAKAIAADNENLDPFDVSDDHHKDDHKHDDHGHDSHDHHGHEEKGTIAELWEAAVDKHPEIVAKYGEFSGELLQAMLGIPILDPLPANPSSPTKPSVEPTNPGQDSRKDSYFIEDQYAKLASGAQEVIMAGKLGKAVVSFPDHSQLDSTFTIHENAEGEPDNQPLRFEISDEPVAQDYDLSASAFDAPNARLVRSMRRCERRLLPILDSWAIVDVVMTRFELVYFDAVGVDDNCPNSSVLEALTATKGGKGLRLCDVAAGRRVVGRLSISDITALHVEREMPSEESVPGTSTTENEIVRKTEYWQQKCDGVAFNRRELWHKVKQDRLVAETAHGHTLYLRFFSDFEDAQSHPEHYSADNEIVGDLYKDNAFQWAQTLSRMCGPEQLKQALPHFGDDTNDELRDFLVVHRHETENKGHRRGLSRGLSRGFGSSVRLDALAVQHADANRPGPARRASSFGDTFSGGVPGSHRRAVSQGVDTHMSGLNDSSSHRRNSSEVLGVLDTRSPKSRLRRSSSLEAGVERKTTGSSNLGKTTDHELPTTPERQSKPEITEVEEMDIGFMV